MTRPSPAAGKVGWGLAPCRGGPGGWEESPWHPRVLCSWRRPCRLAVPPTAVSHILPS